MNNKIRRKRKRGRKTRLRINVLLYIFYILAVKSQLEIIYYSL